MKWNYWSYQCKMAKLAQIKAICLYSLGKSESSLIILWLELILGPCLCVSPWEPDTVYCRPLTILNTYTNPWWRLLIDLHVRWRTEQRGACLMCEKQAKVGFHYLLRYLHYFIFLLFLLQNSRPEIRPEQAIDLHIYIQLHKLTETAWTCFVYARTQNFYVTVFMIIDVSPSVV